MSHTAQIDPVNVNTRPIAREQYHCTNKKVGWIERCIVKFRAKRHAKKIMQGLNEAQEILQGKRQSRSLDEFLREL